MDISCNSSDLIKNLKIDQEDKEFYITIDLGDITDIKHIDGSVLQISFDHGKLLLDFPSSRLEQFSV